MLCMDNVFFSYRHKKNTVDILSGLSVDFEAGKVYAIYGPSGIGKTTCLSLLGGLEIPNKGYVKIDGTDIKQIGYSCLRKQYVSFIFQDYHLFPYMTAIENVTVAATIAGKSQDVNIKQQAVELLARLGLEKNSMNRPVSQISGGQQQRTAIARALIKDAKYILADEPTGNLDRENAQLIIEILVALAHEQNKCVIIATHSDLVCSHADISMQMCHGKLCVKKK